MGIFEALPWSFYEDDTTRFWVHYGLVLLGLLLAVITFIVQWLSPAPYGKHERTDANWGVMIPQRIGHILSDAVPDVLLFLIRNKSFSHGYKNPYVALGITLGGFFPNCLYHFVNADFIGSAHYNNNYFFDPRFIIGIVLFIVGYIINKWADWKLRSLRDRKGSTGYYIPYGGLFELVTCPNYFGEFVEWIGWSIATWSAAGFVWTVFASATFFPRARHNHQW
ncbi:SRD5A1 [Mytilus edulis]|uniref:SRD5A1 n=1 Tax=Mytilus edulis TaxID=6550 RepID=A0A8S3VPJ5_MYTED|nr:SRD5A1 [Mytilus edulis]